MSDGSSSKSPPPSLELTHEEVPRAPEPRAPRPRPQPPQMPMWAKWATSLGVIVILLVALVLYVDHHNTNDSNGQRLTKTGLEEENHEAAALEQQDEAPRKFNLTGGPTDISSVVRAAKVVMEQRISQRQAGPPLKPAQCKTTTASGTQQGYSCVVESGDVNYDFVAVVDPPVKSLVICKLDPPTPTVNVPLNAACYPSGAG